MKQILPVLCTVRAFRALAVLLGAALAALAMGGFFGAFSLDEANATHGSSSIHGCSNGYRTVPPCGAKGWYVRNGDIIVASDERQDGHGAIVYWRVVNGSANGKVIDRGADGNPAAVDKNLSEGKRIRFTVCLSEGSGAIGFTCSAYYSRT